MSHHRRPRLLLSALILIALLILASPMLMVVLPASALPWDRLANIGDAYGGVSALLSGLALCGVGASLIFQQRQIRQDMTGLVRQNHLELMRLAIENPDLIKVLDAEASQRPDPRGEVFANLTVSYWLAIWELGEMDDEELRGVAAPMFGSTTTREWWRRVGPSWIGARARPERARFMEILSQECVAAGSSTEPLRSGRRAPVLAWGALVAAGAVTAGGMALSRRRSRPR